MARGIQSYRSPSISTQSEIPPIVAGKRDLALVILVLALGRTSPQALSTASRLDTSVPERRCTHISYTLLAVRRCALLPRWPRSTPNRRQAESRRDRAPSSDCWRLICLRWNWRSDQAGVAIAAAWSHALHGRRQTLLAGIAGEMMPDDGGVNVVGLNDESTRACVASAKALDNLLRPLDLPPSRSNNQTLPLR